MGVRVGAILRATIALAAFVLFTGACIAGVVWFVLGAANNIAYHRAMTCAGTDTTRTGCVVVTTGVVTGATDKVDSECAGQSGCPIRHNVTIRTPDSRFVSDYYYEPKVLPVGARARMEFWSGDMVRFGTVHGPFLVGSSYLPIWLALGLRALATVPLLGLIVLACRGSITALAAASRRFRENRPVRDARPRRRIRRSRRTFNGPGVPPARRV